MNSLSYEDWQSRRERHLARISPWVEDRVRRSQHGIKHPVYDFLFEYYWFRPAQLARWTPGYGVLCERMTVETCDWPESFEQVEAGMILLVHRLKHQRRLFLDFAIKFLRTTAEREPTFHCFGMHEWAMVYRTNEIRHSQVPLRLPHSEIDAFVESLPLRCTHYDAFRFFTPAAVPLNRLTLSRQTTTENDQPGCIHANMDLYKFSFSVSPFLPSELIVDCFELAIAAREIDMRASPYDLRSFGYEPILIESKDGREEYIVKQREIAEWAKPIRLRLLAAYETLQSAVNSLASPPANEQIENKSISLSMAQ